MEQELIKSISIATIISSLIVYRTVINYKIKKDFNSNNELEILDYEKFKSKLDKDNFNHINTLILKEDIISFIEILKNNFNQDDLNNLYNNLKTLKTNESKFPLKRTAGYYVPRCNKISFIKSDKENVVNHELFHLASTFFDKQRNIAFCGFGQINYNKKMATGIGLNEGYTEVLTKRYFNDYEYTSYSYKVLDFFALRLEEIIGKDKMQSLYMNADLKGLINELKKYDTEENIYNFIDSLDFILEYVKYTDSNMFKLLLGDKSIDKIYKKISIIQETLFKWYIKKEEERLNNNLITKDEFDNNINSYRILLEFKNDEYDTEIEYNKKEITN